MLNKLFIATILIALLNGCASGDRESPSVVSEKEADSSKQGVFKNIGKEDLIPYDASIPDPDQYCYINKVYTENGKTFLEADFIQFLMGDEAVKAARQRGDAMAVINDTGDTTWSLLDDIYILNENKKTRKLPLADNAEYLVVYIQDNVYRKHSTIDELAAIKNNNGIYILTIDGNNAVTKIKQQYLP